MELVLEKGVEMLVEIIAEMIVETVAGGDCPDAQRKLTILAPRPFKARRTSTQPLTRLVTLASVKTR